MTNCHLRLVLGGTCVENYSCDKTCYRLKDCTLLEFFQSGCFGQRKVSYTCTSTCQRCCHGYIGDNCDTPVCFGLFWCPNGGTCISPDVCNCPAGFALPYCQDVNECALGISGCDQICTNTQGSFVCSCQTGYVLSKDEWKCEDIDECTLQLSGCVHLCNNEDGSYTCSCHEGYYLDYDGKNCLDAEQCRAQICNNHGICLEGEGIYTCLCEAGFTGKHCQTDVNECEIFNGGCQDICTNTVGSFICSCSDGQESTNGLPCTRGNAVTVFERQQIPGQLLPEACFTIEYVGCTERICIDVYFASTSPWYELNSDTDIVYTFGIVFVKVNSLSVPLSLRGMEFRSANEGFAISYKVRYSSANGTLIEGDLSPVCLTFEFSDRDFFDFISVDSFTKTLLQSLNHVLPDWLKFEKSNTEILSVQDIKTDLVFGRNMDSVKMCAGAPVFPSHLYVVFRSDTGFSLRVLGNYVYFPQTSESLKYCLIVDITQNYIGTVFLMIPEESRDILSDLNIMKALKEKQNINVHPRGIGISLVNGVRSDHRSFSGDFWNGDTTFQPSLGAIDFWMGGSVHKVDRLFTVQGNADIFLGISRIESMLTSMFREAWTGAVDIQGSVTFTLRFGAFSIALQLDPSTANIFTSIGGSSRTWCGEFSNPQGIFLSGMVERNPFIGEPFLEDFVIYLTSRVYAYVAADAQINPPEGIYINIHEEILNLDEFLNKVDGILNVYISKLYLNETFVEIVEMREIVYRMRTEISGNIDNFLSGNFERLINHIENIWHYYNQLMDALENFAQESEFHVYEDKVKLTEMLNTNIFNITENIRGILNEVSQRTISSAGSYTGLGIKFSADLTIFGLKLIEFDFEIEEGDSFRCSRFDKIRKLLGGEKALRFLGRASRERRLGTFIKIEEGFELGAAYAINSDKRVLQLQTFINILGIKLTRDIFIQETGMNFYLEGNVWGKSFAQIDVRADTGKDWHELTFNIHGKFVVETRERRSMQSKSSSLHDKDLGLLQKERKTRQVQSETFSFQGSYLDAVKKVIRLTSDEAQKRLSVGQSAVRSAQKGLKNAEDWVNVKKKIVREATVHLENAIDRLETAKVRLEEAKEPFQNAIKKLEESQRNVDNLCRIRSCPKICIPGIKCRICYTRIWFIRIPYPCCRITSCMISFYDPFCVIANIACRIIRGIAYVALELAKIVVRVAMTALDREKAAVTSAQFVVDKSRVTLVIAEGRLEVAVIGLNIAKGILEEANKALEGVKFVIGSAAKVLEFVIDFGVKNIIDVRNCGFDIALTTKDLPVFEVFCQVNAFKLGWSTINLRINFKNFLQSIWQAAKATIQAVIKTFAGIFSGRKRRDIEFKTSSKMHVFLRKIRESNGMNISDTYWNQTIDISNDITGFSDAAESDYDHRVQLFREKCNRITVIQNFMQYAFESLQDIVNESKSYIDEVENVTILLQGYKDIDSVENVTLENVGISKEYAAKDYNLTDDDLDKTINETRFAVYDDPLLAEMRSAATISEENVYAETQSVESVDYLNAWFTSMKNMTQDFFNESECDGFKDCVFFSISNLYDLYEYENIPNITNIRESILDLETMLIETFQNESSSILETSVVMEYVLSRINRLVEMNTFCAVPPAFLTPLQNQTVLNGSDVTLFCDVSGDPEPSFIWLKNDTVIAGESSSTIAVLTDKVSFDKYNCIAGNLVANISSNDAYITVIFEDEDECQTGNNNCSHLCNNTIGSYMCSCLEGYELQKDSTYICKDTDECKANNAGCQQACINQEGSFTCACYNGYELDLDNRTCVDINECEINNGHCKNTCINENGSYRCFCDAGLQWSSANRTCIDINECQTDKDECQYACLNFIGNHTCLCPKRSILEDDLKSCRDVKERSVSSSVSIDVDNETVVSDPAFYIAAGKMLENHFNKVTTSVLSVFINNIRKHAIADFTIVLEPEHIEDSTAKLVKAIIDLKAGETVILQGKPVEARSILPENSDDPCQVRELIAGYCKDGLHCSIESGLPFCRKMSDDPPDSDIPIIMSVVGSILAVILLPIFGVICVRCVRKNSRLLRARRNEKEKPATNLSQTRITGEPQDIYIVPRHMTQSKKIWNTRKNDLLTSSTIRISEKKENTEVSNNIRPEQWSFQE